MDGDNFSELWFWVLSFLLRSRFDNHIVDEVSAGVYPVGKGLEGRDVLVPQERFDDVGRRGVAEGTMSV